VKLEKIEEEKGKLVESSSESSIPLHLHTTKELLDSDDTEYYDANLGKLDYYDADYLPPLVKDYRSLSGALADGMLRMKGIAPN
jgi:hypothetical protein